MKQSLIITSAFFVLPGVSLAQNAPPAPVPVPAISSQTLPPPVPLLNTGSVPLPDKAVSGLAIAERWKDAPTMPVTGDDGSVQFMYGATLPTIVCAPLRICDIQLQPGEIVQQIDAGDSQEWQAVPTISGTGPDAVTHVLIKPANSGLTTDLVITTNKRAYTINLISDAKKWMPSISFYYPEEMQSALAAYHQQVQREQDNNVLPSGQNVQNLDFSYSITGADPSWKPQRVYTDGVKTYIDFPGKMLVTNSPVLLALGGNGKTMLVNYRVEGAVYVVDQVLSHAELISGVGGDQTAVKIDYTGTQF